MIATPLLHVLAGRVTLAEARCSRRSSARIRFVATWLFERTCTAALLATPCCRCLRARSR